MSETAEKPPEKGSVRITFSLPTLVARACEAKGAPFGMTAGEFIQQKVLMSAMGGDTLLGLADAVARLQEREGAAALVQPDLALDAVDQG